MPDQPRETHRSFTVRVPMSRYLTMSNRAQAEGKHLNQTVNELLTLGLGEAISLDEALMRLLKSKTVGDNSNG